MLESVKFAGLAAGPVMVQGPHGPFEVEPSSRKPLAVFALDGWDSSGPELDEDEAHGFAVIRAMEAIGDGHADGKWTAEEGIRAAAILEPRLPSQTVISLAIPIAREAFNRYTDDGRLSRMDALSIGKVALSTALGFLAR